MSVNGVGFELYGKNYGSDNNVTSGSDEIQSIFEKINDVTNKKTESESEAQTKETEIEQTNEEEQAQVQEISDNLAQIESQYSAAVTAATSAQSAATSAATNASNLEAAAAALPDEIQQGTNEDGSPKMVPNPAKAAAKAAAEKARAEAEKLQSEAEKLISEAEQMQTTYTELQEALNEVETKQEDTEEKDVELEALNEQIQEFDAEINDLNAQLESAKSEQEAQNSASNSDTQAAESNTVGEPEFNQEIDDNGYTTKQEITQPDGTVITVTEDENGNTIVQSTNPAAGISTTNTISGNDDGYTLNTNSIDNQGNQILNQTIAPNEDTQTELGSNTKVVTDSDGNITGYETTDSVTGIKTTVNKTTGETTYTDKDGNQLSISEVQKKKHTYDRTDANRDAIADHDRKNAINGLENEQDVKGVQLDLDKYYDKYHNQYDATDETSFQEYKDVVADAITNDIAEYAGIDMSEANENRYTELKSVYETIANNIGYEVDETQIPDNVSPEQYYINQVNQELAYRSWDDALLENDYVDLAGVEKVETTETTNESETTETSNESETTETTNESKTTETSNESGNSQTPLTDEEASKKANELSELLNYKPSDNIERDNKLNQITREIKSLSPENLAIVMEKYNGVGNESFVKTLDNKYGSIVNDSKRDEVMGIVTDKLVQAGVNNTNTVNLICKELYNSTAGKKWGTADEFVIGILKKASPELLSDILDSYGDVTGSELYKDIQNDFSGGTERSLLSTLESSYKTARGSEYTGWDDGKLSIQDTASSAKTGLMKEAPAIAGIAGFSIGGAVLSSTGIGASITGAIAAAPVIGPAVVAAAPVAVPVLCVAGLLFAGYKAYSAVKNMNEANELAQNSTSDAQTKEAVEKGAQSVAQLGEAAYSGAKSLQGLKSIIKPNSLSEPNFKEAQELAAKNAVNPDDPVQVAASETFEESDDFVKNVLDATGEQPVDTGAMQYNEPFLQEGSAAAEAVETACAGENIAEPTINANIGQPITEQPLNIEYGDSPTVDTPVDDVTTSTTNSAGVVTDNATTSFNPAQAQGQTVTYTDVNGVQQQIKIPDNATSQLKMGGSFSNGDAHYTYSWTNENGDMCKVRVSCTVKDYATVQIGDGDQIQVNFDSVNSANAASQSLETVSGFNPAQAQGQTVSYVDTNGNVQDIKVPENCSISKVSHQGEYSYRYQWMNENGKMCELIVSSDSAGKASYTVGMSEPVEVEFKLTSSENLSDIANATDQTLVDPFDSLAADKEGYVYDSKTGEYLTDMDGERVSLDSFAEEERGIITQNSPAIQDVSVVSQNNDVVFSDKLYASMPNGTSLQANTTYEVSQGTRLNIGNTELDLDSLDIQAGDTVTVGRANANNADILINDNGVSAQHLQITKTETGYVIKDLESTNGTTVSHSPLVLRHSDGSITIHKNISGETYDKIFGTVNGFVATNSAQQLNGDCYFISSLNALYDNSTSRNTILSCFHETSNGITVSLPNCTMEFDFDAIMRQVELDPTQYSANMPAYQALEYVYAEEKFAQLLEFQSPDFNWETYDWNDFSLRVYNDMISNPSWYSNLSNPTLLRGDGGWMDEVMHAFGFDSVRYDGVNLTQGIESLQDTSNWNDTVYTISTKEYPTGGGHSVYWDESNDIAALHAYQLKPKVVNGRILVDLINPWHSSRVSCTLTLDELISKGYFSTLIATMVK